MRTNYRVTKSAEYHSRMVFCPRKMDHHVREKVQSVYQVHSSFTYRRTLRDWTHNDTKVHRSYSYVSVGFKHTILFSLLIHLVMNYITSMPQYIPRRGREGKNKGATSPAGFPGIIRDTRGAYKSCVINGKCYIGHQRIPSANSSPFIICLASTLVISNHQWNQFMQSDFPLFIKYFFYLGFPLVWRRDL